MSDELYSDSTFVVEETSEDTSNAQESEYNNQERQLTNQYLDELWQQLRKINDQRKQKEDYFNNTYNHYYEGKGEPCKVPDLVNMSKITDGIFASYATQNTDYQNQQNIYYLYKLKVYQPKLITIYETRKFWQMYKNNLSADQVYVLYDYVQSQSSYIERQKFINKTKVLKE